MKREEEIKKQSEIYSNDTANYVEWGDGWEDYNDIEYVERAFMSGVKWADEHPKEGLVSIEKVAEWLDSNFPSIDGVGSWYKESFINRFKKVAEL